MSAIEVLRQEPPLRILLVEDDANDAELVRACLNETYRGGAEISRVSNLADGLRVLETQDIHLTILDLDLPDSSGFNTLDRVRVAARGPVIVVTANPHPSLVEEALKRRAFEVLHKNDLDAAALKRVVRLAAMQHDTEERFRETFDRAAVGLAHIAPEGQFQLVNRKLCEILGYAREELATRTVYDISHPDDREVTQARRARLHRGEIESFEAIKRYLRKDGTAVWVELSVAVLRDADGRARYDIAVMEEISERRQAEQALQRSERRATRLSQMFATLSAATEAAAHLKDEQALYQRVCEIAVQHGGMKLAAVRLLERSSGWLRAVAAAGPARYIEKAEISIDPALPEGRGLAAQAFREERAIVINDVLAEPRLQLWWETAREEGIAAAACIPLLRGGQTCGLIFLYSGEVGWFDDELVVLAQRLAVNVSHALDALDAETGLRQSEARFRSLANLSSDWYWEQDEALRFSWYSPGAERHGGSTSDSLGRQRWEMPGAMPLTGTWEDHKAVLEARHPFRDFEYLRTLPGGGARYVSISGEPRFDDAGKFHGYRGTAREVTERKLAELALRQSEARFRGLTELSSDWYWEQDEDYRLRYVSSGFETLAGANAERVMGTRVWDLPDLQPVSSSWDAFRAAAKRHEPFRDFEYMRVAPDGERFYLTISGQPVFDEQGRFKGYRGTGRNVTQRRRAEEELRRFRAALNASADSMFVVDIDSTTIIDLNDAAARSLGYAREELLGRSPAVLLADGTEDDLRGAYARLKSDSDSTELFRSHFRRKDGSLVPVEVTRRVMHSDERTYVVGIARDITERIKAEERLQQSVERFEIVARATNDVVWDWNLHTDELWWNEHFTTAFGYAPHEIGAYIDSWSSRIHPDELEKVKGVVHRALEQGDKVWSGEYRFLCKDGTYATVYDRGLIIYDAAGRATRMIGAMVDITERKRAEEQLRLHAQRSEGLARLGEFGLSAAGLDEVFMEAVRLLRASGCDVANVVQRTDAADGCEFVLRAALGEGAETSVGLSAFVKPDSKWRVAIEQGATVVSDREHYKSRKSERPWAGWLRRMSSGVYVPIHGERGPFGVLAMYGLREQAFNDDDLRFAEAVANVLSATLRRQQAATRLAHLAQYDPLTGLPNRGLLQDRLALAIVQARRRQAEGAVLFIDLDRFKLVNDTLGHHVGDALIAEVGRRLKLCVRAEDTVGRVSGDEFAVVLTELAHADDAAIVAQKALDALARTVELGVNETYVTASIGISSFPADGEDAETLLKNADMAMYRAKLTRNAYCFFTSEMNERSVAKLQLNTDLRRAIDRREFFLHYQPKIDLRDGRPVGAEALLRWNHPERGVVSPAEFIPALEDSGLILAVGDWVIEEACEQLRRWQLQGIDVVPIAVNLSAKQFRRHDLDAFIRRMLAENGLAAQLIELEITESCLVEDPEEAVRLLRSLRDAGLGISVDDFGTGYSSLSYLTRLPLNALKIDRSFVRDVVGSSEAASIVRAVIDMAHNLNFTVIAEGVETEEQLGFLRRHGCDLGQGYLFGQPMGAAQLAERLGRLS